MPCLTDEDWDDIVKVASTSAYDDEDEKYWVLLS